MPRTSRRIATALLIALVWWPLAVGSSATAGAERSTLRVRVHDANGVPLPARVRLSPTSAVERLRLGLWRDRHALSDAATGRAQLELRAGAYQLFVSCGPEWSLARAAVELAPGAQVERAVVLEHQVQLPGYRGADLHVHTERSSDAGAHGGVSALALRAEGVELAVGTDHNAVGQLGPAIDSLPGAEITTWDPEVGHFNAFPLRRAPRWRGTSPAQLFATLARDPGVFVQINHPRLDPHIAYFELGGYDGERFARPEFALAAHGLEVWNGYDLARAERVHALLQEWRAIVARGVRLTATGGSDSHGVAGHHPGYPRTYVRTAGSSGLAAALQAGHAFVTNGPLLALRVQGREPGETAVPAADGELDVELRVLAADWLQLERLELWADERRVLSLPIVRSAAGGPLDFAARVRVRVPARQTRALHAVVRGGRGLEGLLGRSGVEPLAFTNAVYLAPPDHSAPAPRRRASQDGDGPR